MGEQLNKIVENPLLLIGKTRICGSCHLELFAFCYEIFRLEEGKLTLCSGVVRGRSSVFKKHLGKLKIRCDNGYTVCALVEETLNRVPMTPRLKTAYMPLVHIEIIAVVVNLNPRILKTAFLNENAVQIAVDLVGVHINIEVTRYDYGAVVLFLILVDVIGNLSELNVSCVNRAIVRIGISVEIVEININTVADINNSILEALGVIESAPWSITPKASFHVTRVAL